MAASVATPGAALHSELVEYKDPDGKQLCGYVAWSTLKQGPRPAVLVAHAATGPQDEFVHEKVHELAALGYVAMALDMYGAGKVLPFEEARAQNRALRSDRTLVAKRGLAALAAVKAAGGSHVMPNKVAAIGYCIGGLVVLDLARAAPKGLLGVVSFHGGLDDPGIDSPTPLPAKVLVCHGSLDPHVKPDAVNSFCEEMLRKEADMQLMSYSGCYHGFTHPHLTAESDKAKGVFYSESADRRSWQLMTLFLEELFALPVP